MLEVGGERKKDRRIRKNWWMEWGGRGGKGKKKPSLISIEVKVGKNEGTRYRDSVRSKAKEEDIGKKLKRKRGKLKKKILELSWSRKKKKELMMGIFGGVNGAEIQVPPGETRCY